MNGAVNRKLSGCPQRRVLSAGALAVAAPWPTTGPTLAFLQLLLGAANPAYPGLLLLGILDPADELVAGQRRDVPPGIECRGVGNQGLAQVSWKFVHHPTRNLRTTHRGHGSGVGATPPPSKRKRRTRRQQGFGARLDQDGPIRWLTSLQSNRKASRHREAHDRRRACTRRRLYQPNLPKRGVSIHHLRVIWTNWKRPPQPMLSSPSSGSTVTSPPCPVGRDRGDGHS